MRRDGVVVGPSLREDWIMNAKLLVVYELLIQPTVSELLSLLSTTPPILNKLLTNEYIGNLFI